MRFVIQKLMKRENDLIVYAFYLMRFQKGAFNSYIRILGININILFMSVLLHD